MAAMNRSLIVWLLVIVLLACSCAAPVCASRPLAAAAAGDARRVLATAGFATVSRFRRIPGSSARPTQNRRRLLGTRTTSWLPPPPLPNKMKATAMPAPPPPRI